MSCPTCSHTLRRPDPFTALVEKMTLAIADLTAGLQLLRERPADDGPRLVYADELERLGECDRAALIRIQCEMVAMDGVECEAPASPGLVPCAEWNAKHPSRNNWCKPCKKRDALRRLEWELLAAWKIGEQGSNCKRWAPDIDGFKVWSFMTENDDRMLSDPLDKEWHGGWSNKHTSIHFKWHRGFISTIRCPLALWVGEACGRCGGTGSMDVSKEPCSTAVRDCFHCSGTGRVNALGKRIVRADNVVCERVETDKRPQKSFGDPLHVWYREGSPYDVGDDILPSEIWYLLKGYRPITGAHFQKYYDTASAANSALSDVLIGWAWGKVDAGIG